MQHYLDLVSNIPVKDLFLHLNVVNIIELSIIGLILFAGYKKFIKGTQSENLLKGIIMLLVALLLSKFLILLQLQILGKFLESLVSIIIFGLVVIFQPELRRFLGYLGQPGFFSKNLFTHDISETEDSNSVAEITEAVKYLSKSHIGALIVVQATGFVDNYMEVGTKLNAKVSTELLLTIFHPNTALHDGAVVICGDIILSAGVLLPLTDDPKLSWQYGTRHRAAIGMSEISDAVCLVVSEERGQISVAQNGELVHFDTIDELEFALEKIYGPLKKPNGSSKSGNIFKFSGEFSKLPIFNSKEINKE